MIEPKEVIGAFDPPLLTLRELWEPGQREEPLRVWGSGRVSLWEENVLGQERDLGKPQVTRVQLAGSKERPFQLLLESA